MGLLNIPEGVAQCLVVRGLHSPYPAGRITKHCAMTASGLLIAPVIYTFSLFLFIIGQSYEKKPQKDKPYPPNINKGNNE